MLEKSDFNIHDMKKIENFEKEEKNKLGINNLFKRYKNITRNKNQIIVDTEVNNKNAIITIKNKCDKISKEKLDTLFEKFIRLDDEMTRTTRGTGLGLFIVKGLVEAMNGKIELDSSDEYGFIARITLNTVNANE